ncbi:hypothetical protein F5Y11DRAFT_351033 [Daldinia sp. FL1419]|nr:hypothetical protein F5Y11DRAFT_351033 [Daldinia sp. FL1419]
MTMSSLLKGKRRHSWRHIYLRARCCIYANFCPCCCVCVCTCVSGYFHIWVCTYFYARPHISLSVAPASAPVPMLKLAASPVKSPKNLGLEKATNIPKYIEKLLKGEDVEESGSAVEGGEILLG